MSSHQMEVADLNDGPLVIAEAAALEAQLTAISLESEPAAQLDAEPMPQIEETPDDPTPATDSGMPAETYRPANQLAAAERSSAENQEGVTLILSTKSNRSMQFVDVNATEPKQNGLLVSSSDDSSDDSLDITIEMSERRQKYDGSDSSKLTDEDQSTDMLLSPFHSSFQPEFSRMDFFEKFSLVPTFDEMSLSMSDDLISLLSVKSSHHIKTDKGKFVDPITGEVLSSSGEKETTIETVVEDTAIEEQEDSSTDQLPAEDDDLLAFVELEHKEVILEKVKFVEPSFLDEFLLTDLDKTSDLTDVLNFEVAARTEETQLMKLAIQEFVAELIGNVADLCLSVSPQELLRRNLNKKKLMLQLVAQLIELNVEKKACWFLNRKMVEFYRRKRAFRPITDSSPTTLVADMAKYKEALVHLDNQLGREQEVQKMLEEKIKQLHADHLDASIKAKNEDERFEQLVRKTVLRENFNRLQVSLDRQLKEMMRIRDEISSQRLVLLEKQHIYRQQIEQLTALGNLGNGMDMRDFERLETETKDLDKKMEERNNELSRIRQRFNTDLHVISHIKEKGHMLRGVMTVQSRMLGNLNQERQSLRHYLHQLKVERGQIRKKINDLSFQSGLLDKPELMLDYDATVERMKIQRETVDQLKVQYAEVEHKLANVASKWA